MANEILTSLGSVNSSFPKVTGTTVGSKHGLDVVVKSGVMTGLESADYIAAVESPTNTITYTFKSGGSGGSTLGTVVIVYTGENDFTVTRS